MTTTAAPSSSATNGAHRARIVYLDTVASRWESALDSAQRAVNDAGGSFGLPAAVLDHRRRELVHERQRVAHILRLLARETGVPRPWLSPVPITPRMLGVDAGIAACVFDLDGVLTNSFDHALSRRGVTALPASRRYLEACGHAGLGRAVVSASANALSMLERAGLDTLIEVRIDAAVIRAEGLRSRPAPDLVLAACRRLGAAPEHVVSLTHTPAGVVGAHAAGAHVIAVADGRDAEVLRDYGAERVVSSLGRLLAPGLAAHSATDPVTMKATER